MHTPYSDRCRHRHAANEIAIQALPAMIILPLYVILNVADLFKSKDMKSGKQRTEIPFWNRPQRLCFLCARSTVTAPDRPGDTRAHAI